MRLAITILCFSDELSFLCVVAVAVASLPVPVPFPVPVPGPVAPLDFFASLALLNITVNPSAEAGLFTSHSPNLGRGRPFSCCR
ncbi:hypothetical protein CFP56_010298 [Quercus suber]|uniref:Secreted peptide n=1 Tax=Quercus suber TaxID=58331 RepID=A0AAW0L163_QUESU